MDILNVTCDERLKYWSENMKIHREELRLQEYPTFEVDWYLILDLASPCRFIVFTLDSVQFRISLNTQKVCMNKLNTYVSGPLDGILSMLPERTSHKLRMLYNVFCSMNDCPPRVEEESKLMEIGLKNHPHVSLKLAKLPEEVDFKTGRISLKSPYNGRIVTYAIDSRKPIKVKPLSYTPKSLPWK